jgi:hypothetical protein
MTTIRDTNLSATLDLSQINLTLPAQVDYLVEFDSLADFPQPGAPRRLYTARDTRVSYLWTGTTYSPVADLPTVFSPTPPPAPYEGQRWTDTFDFTTYEWFMGAWIEKPNNN